MKAMIHVEDLEFLPDMVRMRFDALCKSEEGQEPQEFREITVNSCRDPT